MKKQVLSIVAGTLLAGTFGTLSAAEGESGLGLIDNVKVKGQIRPRYEMVDTNNATSNANALTNRLVLGVSADLAGTDLLSGYVEMTDVHNANDNYNSTANGATGHNVVADPEQTRVTQAYVDLKLNKTTLRAGRQMVNLDNQRFVGAVGWRQMPQTFNAYALMDKSIEGLALMGAYVTQQNKIFAEGSAAGDSADTETVLLNANYKISDALNVSAYGYLIGSTHDTYGIALTGKVPAGDMKVAYRAEYAMQTDASMETGSNGKPDADADYMNLEASINMNGVLAGAGYEVLSGAEGTDTTFSTPLATLHKFNGWADKFLATPTDGLVDMHAMVGYKSKSLGLFKAIYHDFSSDVGSTDYGTELDLLYKRAIPGVKNLSGLVKYADYDADTYSVDTQKFWVMLDYKFSN
jgi:hypothetical protein